MKQHLTCSAARHAVEGQCEQCVISSVRKSLLDCQAPQLSNKKILNSKRGWYSQGKLKDMEKLLDAPCGRRQGLSQMYQCTCFSEDLLSCANSALFEEYPLSREHHAMGVKRRLDLLRELQLIPRRPHLNT